MKVFITGIAGFLGSHLAKLCIDKNYEVIGCDTLFGGDIKNIKDLNIEFHKIDCSDLELMTSAMKGTDVLCHAAAFAHEGLSNVSPKLVCENNVVGSVSAFTAGIRAKVKRIVYCSSMARYGNIPTPYSEDAVPKPNDPYGISKLAAEDILKVLCRTYNVEYNIAIPHNIIGPNQKYDDAFRNVASIMINLILQNRAPTIYGDGSQKRCFSDIDDCITCMDKLMFDPEIKSQTINIGPDEEFISINELYGLISNKLHFNKDPIYDQKRPNEVSEAICSSDRARKILSYKTEISLSDSLDKIIHHIKSEGPKKFQYNYNLEIDSELTPKTWLKKLF
jgi:UDP-glucose 4-epimerase